jgi:integrase/recombinase XerD
MEKFIIRSAEYRSSYAQFIKYLQTIGYSESSIKTLEIGTREFLSWLEAQSIITINSISEQDIKNFYSYQQDRLNFLTGGSLSESRIGINMYVLKLFFRYHQDTEQIQMNPMSNLNYGCSSRNARENLLSVEDIERLYGECNTARERAMLGILYGCGLRKHEAAKLNVRDIHFRHEMLYVREGKGGRKRIVPLNRKVLTDLRDYYYNERPLLLSACRSNQLPVEAFMLNKFGRRMQHFTWSGEIKLLLSKAKLDKRITLHYFRHAIATHLLESGMKMEHVKDFLGHKSIETTQTYTHITTRQMKKTTAYATQSISA